MGFFTAYPQILIYEKQARLKFKVFFYTNVLIKIYKLIYTDPLNRVKLSVCIFSQNPLFSHVAKNMIFLDPF